MGERLFRNLYAGLVDHLGLGLGLGSIYNAFCSKKEIFMEVLEYYDELRLRRLVENEDHHFIQDIRSMALFFSSTIKGLRVFSKSDYPREDLLSIADTALVVLE